MKIVNSKCNDLHNVRAGCLKNKLFMVSDLFALLTSSFSIILMTSVLYKLYLFNSLTKVDWARASTVFGLITLSNI